VTAFTKLAAEIWRDYFTDGVPASGPNPPHKPDIRQWALAVEAGLNNGTLNYKFDTATADADPGVGKLRGNNATIASITQLFISETGFNSEAYAAVIQTWDDSTNTVKGTLTIRDKANVANWVVFNVTGSITDAGAYDKVTVAHIASGGSFAANADLSLDFLRAGDDSAALIVGMNNPLNLSLTFTVAANALTIAMKGVDGNDPSASNPVRLQFKNAADATAQPILRSVTSALSLVVSAGSTLGTLNSTPFRLWVVAFDDAGTIRLGVINCLSSLTIYPLGEFATANSTAEGGAGAADSAQVFYTGTAVTGKAYVILGWAVWRTGLATAGTWSAGPGDALCVGPNDRRPGQVVQELRSLTGAVATGTTAIPADDTIPQQTEGDQYMSQAITPRSPANLLQIDSKAELTNSNVVVVTMALFQDAAADALAAGGGVATSGGFVVQFTLSYAKLAGTLSATTFKIRAGGSTGATTTFNGSAGTRRYGGVANSHLTVREIMA
jgi:hypothetical protein